MFGNFQVFLKNLVKNVPSWDGTTGKFFPPPVANISGEKFLGAIFNTLKWPQKPVPPNFFMLPRPLAIFSGGNSLFPVGGGGAKPSKLPTKLSNFRQTVALEKAVFCPLLGQHFQKFIIFCEGGWRPPPPPASPRFPPLAIFQGKCCRTSKTKIFCNQFQQ